ncbi:K(+)-transporting ATPase subunit C [Verrucomicrobium spinosum]|uniref:K(+)-transporting ATPase subunit C n=1 Tax=Verrucomicrobium spinosum TaxID=2736 RepID=UPI0009466AA3|nr:K(+)-transporting ATPase subunit C [Verrucomicrobium spinosum]
MKSFLLDVRGAVVSTLVFVVVLCGIYPVVVWAVAQGVFRDKANGSLIRDADGTPGFFSAGAELYRGGLVSTASFSAGANGYDAASSGGSNLGPTSQKLADAVKDRIASYRESNGLKADEPVPADAVTASGSGLDPHISLRNAELQTARVARARKLSEDQVRSLVQTCIEGPGLGVLGDAGVNVLRLNLALEKLSSTMK